jgi:hypothetical protein
MKTTTDTLKVTWKFIRRKGYGRTPATYCSYVAENERHKHKLKTLEGTKLFDLLQNTTISKKPEYLWSVFVDATYYNNKLISITNPRKL